MKQLPLVSAVALSCLLMGSCSTAHKTAHKPQGCASDPKFEQEWKTATITRDHPIVDVHTHLFNSRYLPLKHVVKARMWAGGVTAPLTLLANGLGLTDAAAVLLATSTPSDECQARERQAKVDAYLKKRNESRDNDVHLFHALTHNPVSEPHLFIKSQSSSRGQPEDIGPLAYLAYHTFGHEFLADYIARWFVHDPADLSHGVTGVAPFGVSMMSSERESWERMTKAFPTVDLFVYQSMDLVPSFFGGVTHTYSYSKDDHGSAPGKSGDAASLPRIRRMCAESDGRLIHFVAWNPFRTLNLTDNMVASLDVVKLGIKRGASGVKFYPPLGYRPACNDFSDYKKPFFLSEARSQWNNRYLGRDRTGRESEILKKRAAEMDRVNEELFAWCADNDIPIFTHCNTGEFRAFHTEEYAENANPAYWEPVLARHPNLRLCFGHAGGITDWYGPCAKQHGHVKGSEQWGAKVRDLCRRYRNVYCEFGIHENVANSATAEPIYRSLQAELPQSASNGKGWKLADKVMYGSDYFMPVGVAPDKYLEGFERLFSLPGLQCYKARFFSGNAMKYLKREVKDRTW